MELHIRQADETDLEAVLALQAILDPPGTPMLPLEQARCLFARLERYPDYRIWLAEHAGRAVGTYSLVIFDNLAHHGRRAGLVENVAVDPAAQGLGIGKAMMEHARARCRERNCYKLALSSNLIRTEAHAFYEALGFERHGYSFKVEP
jgi:GNAT superfamily N-acetyltransferase